MELKDDVRPSAYVASTQGGRQRARLIVQRLVRKESRRSLVVNKMNTARCVVAESDERVSKCAHQAVPIAFKKRKCERIALVSDMECTVIPYSRAVS